MAVNDKAIYSTKPIKPYKEGKVCVTKKDSAVYAIYLVAKNKNEPPTKIWLSSIQPKNNAQLTLLGTKKIWNGKKSGRVL